MNPFALLAALAQLRLSQPVRLWLYGVGAVVLGGLVLAGVITGDWETYGLIALGQVLAVPAAEAARLGVYSPRYLADRGVIDGESRDVAPVVQLEVGGPAVELSDDTRAFPALYRVAPPRPRPAQ